MSGNVNSLFAVEGLCLKATMTEVSLMPRNKTRISWGKREGGGCFLECNHEESKRETQISSAS